MTQSPTRSLLPQIMTFLGESMIVSDPVPFGTMQTMNPATIRPYMMSRSFFSNFIMGWRGEIVKTNPEK